jgi:hypothetical protein
MDKVAEEITAGQAVSWPKKGLLPTSKLTVKYAILNMIDTANWAPTDHSLDHETYGNQCNKAANSLSKLDY